MRNFLEFVERKQRESLKHLKLIANMLENDFSISKFLENKDPYIFVKVPKENKSLSFSGLRIYEIGDCMAFRIQQDPDTEPYGMAYSIKINEMFNDFMSDMDTEEEVIKEIKKSIIKEIKNFFIKTQKAEEDMINKGANQNNLIMKAGGTDYSGMVLNKY